MVAPFKHKLKFNEKGSYLETRIFPLLDGKPVLIRIAPEEHAVYLVDARDGAGDGIVLASKFGTDLKQLKRLAKQFITELGVRKPTHRRPKGANKPLGKDV